MRGSTSACRWLENQGLLRFMPLTWWRGGEIDPEAAGRTTALSTLLARWRGSRQQHSSRTEIITGCHLARVTNGSLMLWIAVFDGSLHRE